MRSRLSIILLLALLFQACSRPASDEAFVGYADRDAGGGYCFELAMDGEDWLYDLDIYLLFEGQRDKGLPQGLNAVTVLTGPDGTIYEGLLELDRYEDCQQGRFTKMYLYGFGQGLKPVAYGDWKLQVALPEEIDNGKDVDGVGIRLRRYGSR